MSPTYCCIRAVDSIKQVKEITMGDVMKINFIRNKNKIRTIDGKCEILIGDALEALKGFPDQTFQCCITSPPYWGLRDYGIRGQIGAEMDVEDYVWNLVGVFAEVKRTLKDDGILWLNIGDSYTSGGRTWRQKDSKNKGRAMNYRPPTPEGLKPKDLIGIPWKVAFALQANGWYLRSDIIWNKPNCQPESVKDRPTRSHEYIFLFSKSKFYYYDYEAIMEQGSNGKKKNKRSVWNINTNGFKGTHFAVFPPALVEPCILAGSKKESKVLDPFLGSGTVAEVCLKLKRICIGVELKPDYAELAVQRLRNMNLELF